MRLALTLDSRLTGVKSSGITMAADEGVQREWVMRVLGVDLSLASEEEEEGEEAPTIPPTDEEEEDEALALQSEEEPESTDPQEIYDAARQHVADALDVLAAMLKQDANPLAGQIAEYGLLGLTNGQHVALTKSLLVWRTASPQARGAAGKEVKAAVDGYRKRLDERIFTLLDDNPAGIDIGWSGTLRRALDRIEQTVG